MDWYHFKNKYINWRHVWGLLVIFNTDRSFLTFLGSASSWLFLRPCFLSWTRCRLLCQFPLGKAGHDSKKSVDWSDTDVILPGESIDKAIVSLQISEVLNDEAIQVLLRQKNLNWQSDCIVSIPRILKMKRYRYFFAKKFESAKQLYRFKPQNF